MEYLLGLIALLGGGLFFYRTKAKSSGALLENNDTKRELNKIEGQTEVLAGQRTIEQERREAIRHNTQEAGGDVSNDELIKFIDALGTKRKP